MGSIVIDNLPTLSSINKSADKLAKAFGCDPRYPESMLQKFIAVNKKTFDFLGISCKVEQVDYRFSLSITTSKYIGAIPLISPKTGKPICDLTVRGRYNEEVGELLSLLSDSIQPEYSDQFRLTQTSQQKPPVYIECCKFVDKYIECDRFNWHKFSNEVRCEHLPKSSTQWTEYTTRTASDPSSFDQFHNKCNILTKDHPEWNQLNYVLLKVIAILQDYRTPVRTKAVYQEKLLALKNKLQSRKTEETTEVRISQSDPRVVKDLKTLANIILRNEINEKVAWRMDYSEFFERYVQYLLSSVATRRGAKSHNNAHYPNIGAKSQWSLAYLEPDIVLQKDMQQIVVDAKYKSHIFNWNEKSDELKDTFRHDLHQILAYCSFNDMSTKHAMLIYPFTDFTYRKMKLSSPLSRTDADVYLVGIPLEKAKLEEVKEGLGEIILFEENGL